MEKVMEFKELKRVRTLIDHPEIFIALLIQQKG